MRDFPFLWTFLGVAMVVDMVGFFYLWRRRSSPVSSSHRMAPSPRQRLRIPLAERRRKERRRTGRAASA
jgi:hypothetical protein